MEVANIMSSIVRGPMLDVDMQRVIEIINAKIGAVPAYQAPQKKASMQVHMFVHRYLSHRDWQIFQSPAIPVEQKLNHMAARFVSIGLFHPTEKTVAHTISVVLAASDDRMGFSTQVLTCLRDFKRILKGQLLRLPAGTVVATQAPEDNNVAIGLMLFSRSCQPLG
jgi:hypothetical protein